MKEIDGRKDCWNGDYELINSEEKNHRCSKQSFRPIVPSSFKQTTMESHDGNLWSRVDVKVLDNDKFCRVVNDIN